MEADEVIKHSSFCYEKAQESLALITFFVLSLRGCLGYIGIDTIFLTILLNLLILSSINYRKINPIIICIPFLSILVIVNKQILGFVDLILMCLILKKTSITKLAKIYFFVLMVFIPIWLFLFKFGYLESKRYFDPAKGGEFFSYGFTNPNVLGIFGFHIIASLSVIYKSRINILIIALMIFINQIFYTFSYSRTAWIGGTVLIFSILFYRLNGFKEWMKYPLSIFPIIITILLVYLSNNASNFIDIDLLTSGRLSIYKSVLSGMSKFNWLVGTKLPDGPMDGSYMMILFYGGILATSIYWILNFRMMIYYYNKIKAYLPFIMGIMACGVMETTFSACGGLSVLYWYLLINPNHIQNNTFLFNHK